jgi:Predicted endonuclease containing a URI domain
VNLYTLTLAFSQYLLLLLLSATVLAQQDHLPSRSWLVPSSSSSWRTHSVSASRTSNNKKQLYTFARKSPSPSKSKQGGAYCYSLNLQNGKKYVGYTTDINRRLKEHFSGRGAKVTQQLKTIVSESCAKMQIGRKCEKGRDNCLQ